MLTFSTLCVIIANVEIFHTEKEVSNMYKINITTVTNEDGETAQSYGITYDSREIYDISTDKEKVERLIALCNEGNLSPIHIDNIIDDFLVGTLV